MMQIFMGRKCLNISTDRQNTLLLKTGNCLFSIKPHVYSCAKTPAEAIPNDHVVDIDKPTLTHTVDYRSPVLLFHNNNLQHTTFALCF